MENQEFEEEFFDLNEIPEGIHSFFLEKLTYTEYAIFNRCSRLSASICTKNAHLKFDYSALNIRFSDTDWMFNGRIGEIPLETVPDNARLKCIDCFVWVCGNPWKSMKFQRPFNDDHYLEIVRVHQVSAKKLEIRSETNPQILQRLLQIMKPGYVVVEDNMDALELPDFQNLNMVQIQCIRDRIDDRTFLGLKASSLWILEKTFITMEGIIAFSKQWLRKEREIKTAVIAMENFDMKAFRKGVEGHFTELEREDFLNLCRSESHDDCISVRKSVESVAFGSAAKCPRRQQ